MAANNTFFDTTVTPAPAKSLIKLVELRRIYKTFSSNGARALEGADFELRQGEIHAIFGENGAGKSTLMQILAGFEQADSGEIIINGKKRHFLLPADALALGISMVRQRPELCRGMRVWEACVLGAETRRGPFFRKRASRDTVNRLSREWGFDLPIDAPSENLDAAGRQKAAVLAALLKNARIIIFDEATAVLNQTESEKIFELIKRLSAAGLAAVIVSHKLDETLTLARRASILRKGISVGVLDKSEFNIQKIISLMFGQDAAPSGGNADVYGAASAKPAGKQDTAEQNITLAAEKLSAEQTEYPPLRSISMELRGGEIYGLAGVRESGVETLLLTLSGFLQIDEGRVLICGKPVFDTTGGNTSNGKNTLNFRKAGGVYLGIDGGRSIAACDKELSIHDNMIIHAHRRFPHPNRLLAGIGILDSGKLREWTQSLMQKAVIGGPPNARTGSLSGGMLQRLLVARELSENAVAILMSEPGWGLDARRRMELYRMLRDESETGKSVLLFLSDLNDLLEVSGEIFVMTNGKIALNQKNRPADHAEAAAVKTKINAAMCGAAV
ncbi:MAG: ATP-binding cassette domain-containing protein [Spirochaetaceae bacterium]|jgi:simple sugar transport system ATP-binding protein|nr:ATP-binding cassette domain-containing protein [Spirochaetaceae bacterium]